MIIDFHTHIFPDKVAEKAIPKLADCIGLAPSMNGTVSGLLASMKDSGVDVSVVLPVVTAPHQFDSILRFAAQTNETFAGKSGPRLISFAGIHPEADNYKEQLRQIKAEGFAGIKLHPNYQGYLFDDIRYLRLIYAASELDLAVLTHAGMDPYTPGKTYCSPDMILHVLKETAPPRLILAHLGNNENYRESEEKLCGQNVYLDTAYSLMHIQEEPLLRMIKKHGADKVLFATDAPWSSQKESVNRLQNLPGLSAKEKQQILFENAAALLKL
jgi:hypothetical protein